MSEKLFLKAWTKRDVDAAYERGKAESEARVAEIKKLVIGWREFDWPEGFDRYTAQLIADHLEERTKEKDDTRVKEERE